MPKHDERPPAVTLASRDKEQSCKVDAQAVPELHQMNVAKRSIPSASTILAAVLTILAVVCCAGFLILPHLDFPLMPLLRLTSASGAIVCFSEVLAVLFVRFVLSPRGDAV